MADQTVPDTDNFPVACLAVAWSIVRLAHGATDLSRVNSADYLRDLATETRQVFRHLYEGEPIPEKK